MTQETLTPLFGWMSVLNIAALGLSTVMVVALQDRIAQIHGAMFQMEPAAIKRAYFRYLANYKLLTLVFCVIPWLALKLV